MFNKVEYLIGLRYTRARKRDNFISLIALISIIGIALGVAVVITVLSVMNGFREEVRDKLLDFTSHGMLHSYDGALRDWEEVAARLDDEASAAAPIIETQAMLMSGDRIEGVYLRGVVPTLEDQVTGIGARFVEGGLKALAEEPYRIALGAALARRLNVRAGDRVTLVSPRASVTPGGILPRVRRMTVGGVFEIGMQQFDRHVGLIHLDDARKFERLDGAVSAVHFRVPDLFEAPAAARRLQLRLGADYLVSDWTMRHRNFFRALEMEKLVLAIIMTLIVAVAAFNIVSTLTMVVNDKQSDIAVLKTLGLRSARIVRIFLTQGCLLGGAGVAAGVVGGTLLSVYLEGLVAALENLAGRKFLSPDVYPITEVPSRLLASDVAVTAAVAFALSLAAAIYPAWRAAAVRPVDALRYG